MSANQEVNGLRSQNAGNRGLFTLDGTRSFIVGRRDPVVIDPGPDDAAHVASIAAELEGATSVRVLLTHGHADHAGATSALVEATNAVVLGPGHPSARPLEDGHSIGTDVGEFITVHTPGHTEDHVCFWWPGERILFAGDLLLGSGNTTWVAGYRHCVADYLTSLDRIEALNARIILPAHGPALTDPASAIGRFRDHRIDRIEQVRAELSRKPTATAGELVTPVYGAELPSAIRGYAEQSIAAILDHLR